MTSIITKIRRRVEKDFRPKKLAVGAKRLDLVSAQVADVLHLIGENGKYPLKGKNCLEIGSGWVLSHSLIFWVLGAKKVVATDIAPVARPYVLKRAINAAIDSYIRDILAPFEDHGELRKRVAKLNSIESFDEQTLKEMGIEYQAPVDLAKEKPRGDFDFIFSNSVMEHVPVDDALPLLKNLNDCLNKGGKMVHRIHLEDHSSIAKDPFKFLATPLKDYPRAKQTELGNRIRTSEWKRIFGELEGSVSSSFFEYVRSEKPVPSTIDSSIVYTDEDDLKSSNVGMLTVKL